MIMKRGILILFFLLASALGQIIGQQVHLTLANGTSTYTSNGNVVFAGNTGGVLLAAATTCFYAPYGNSATNVITADATAQTRNIVTRTLTLTNLYVIRSAAGGVGHTTTVTVMTNGVASSIVASLNNVTTGNDTTHGVTIVSGTEIGIKIVTPAADTPGRHSWAFEAY